MVEFLKGDLDHLRDVRMFTLTILRNHSVIIFTKKAFVPNELIFRSKVLKITFRQIFIQISMSDVKKRIK